MWREEYETWRQRRLDDEQWGYLWVDGIYSGLRAETPGVRESTQSLREVVLNLKARGMSALALAIGDGAMGFWAAMEEIYPSTRQQRCWVHKTNNVLNALAKSGQPKAKQALQEIWRAETKAAGTIRHRTKRTKGCLTRDGMLLMLVKLGRCAEKNWRRLRGFKELAKVLKGIHFIDGIADPRLDPIAA